MRSADMDSRYKATMFRRCCVVIERIMGTPLMPNTFVLPVYMSDASKYQKLMGGLDGDRIEMPKEQIGELMVFKVAERTSFAIVTGTKKPIRVGDIIGDL